MQSKFIYSLAWEARGKVDFVITLTFRGANQILFVLLV